eukprot:COSAG01_NODE_2676_length_7264_cov_6.952128_3_plen_384_part_00
MECNKNISLISAGRNRTKRVGRFREGAAVEQALGSPKTTTIGAINRLSQSATCPIMARAREDFILEKWKDCQFVPKELSKDMYPTTKLLTKLNEIKEKLNIKKDFDRNKTVNEIIRIMFRESKELLVSSSKKVKKAVCPQELDEAYAVLIINFNSFKSLGCIFRNEQRLLSLKEHDIFHDNRIPAFRIQFAETMLQGLGVRYTFLDQTSVASVKSETVSSTVTESEGIEAETELGDIEEVEYAEFDTQLKKLRQDVRNKIDRQIGLEKINQSYSDLIEFCFEYSAYFSGTVINHLYVNNENVCKIACQGSTAILEDYIAAVKIALDIIEKQSPPVASPSPPSSFLVKDPAPASPPSDAPSYGFEGLDWDLLEKDAKTGHSRGT